MPLLCTSVQIIGIVGGAMAATAVMPVNQVYYAMILLTSWLSLCIGLETEGTTSTVETVE